MLQVYALPQTISPQQLQMLNFIFRSPYYIISVFLLQTFIHIYTPARHLPRTLRVSDGGLFVGCARKHWECEKAHRIPHSLAKHPSRTALCITAIKPPNIYSKKFTSLKSHKTQKVKKAPKLQSPKAPKASLKIPKILANFGKIKDILTNHPKTVDTKI